MKTLRTTSKLLALCLVAAAGCEDAQAPTDPMIDPPLTLAEEAELAILADAEAVEMAVSLVETNADAAALSGSARASEGREQATRARLRFQTARQELQRGNRRRAVQEAREARRTVVAGIDAVGGERAVRSMVERLEALSITASQESDAFDDGAAVAKEIDAIARDARGALDRGNLTDAGERAVYGEQRLRQRRPGHDGRPGHVTPDRAELSIALAQTAIALAERLIGDGANDEQLRFLGIAGEFLEKARIAFTEGHYQRAVHFAELANWSALKAVVLPGGITEEEQRQMLELAEGLYRDAVAAVGDTPTELQVHMLHRASRLLEVGAARLADGFPRGVGALWQSSVISSWLIG